MDKGLCWLALDLTGLNSELLAQGLEFPKSLDFEDNHQAFVCCVSEAHPICRRPRQKLLISRDTVCTT